MTITKSYPILSEFVYISEGKVVLGTKYPLPCKTTGKRTNESPVHISFVHPFYISKTCVTNIEFEMFNGKHNRTKTSPFDKSPVTEVTYTEAIEYSLWLSEISGKSFTLPTEEEWVSAASPYGWEYPYKKGPKPKIGFANTHSSRNQSTLQVDDPRYAPNHNDLFHMAGNVSEMVKGVFDAKGHNGFISDGSYCIIKGGDFGHCDFSTRVATRGIFDIASRCTRVGFRLAMHLP